MAQQSTRDEHLDRPRFFVYGVVGGAHLGRPQACPDHWHRGRTVGPAGSRGGRAAHLLEPGLRETGSHSIRWGVSDYTIINLVSTLSGRSSRFLPYLVTRDREPTSRPPKTWCEWRSPRSWLGMVLTDGDISPRDSCTCRLPIRPTRRRLNPGQNRSDLTGPIEAWRLPG
jgi:hypothetical protein